MVLWYWYASLVIKYAVWRRPWKAQKPGTKGSKNHKISTGSNDYNIGLEEWFRGMKYFYVDHAAKSFLLNLTEVIIISEHIARKRSVPTKTKPLFQVF